jgi:hypothetical protein
MPTLSLTMLRFSYSLFCASAVSLGRFASLALKRVGLGTNLRLRAFRRQRTNSEQLQEDRTRKPPQAMWGFRRSSTAEKAAQASACEKKSPGHPRSTSTAAGLRLTTTLVLRRHASTRHAPLLQCIPLCRQDVYGLPMPASLAGPVAQKSRCTVRRIEHQRSGRPPHRDGSPALPRQGGDP